MCDALAALHRAGLLHGDIAPGNILRRSPHDFVLTDFGMSQSVSDVNRTRGGTLSFLAPEQISSSFGTISQRTDNYGLGALLYFMATGRPPFIGCDAPDVFSQIVSSRPPELIPEACGLSTRLNRLIMNCLTKEPSQRILSMETLKQAFLD